MNEYNPITNLTPHIDWESPEEFMTGLMTDLMMTEKDKKKMKAEEIESQLVGFIKTRGEVRTSEIAEEFNLDYPEAHFAVTYLAEKNKIVLSQ